MKISELNAYDKLDAAVTSVCEDILVATICEGVVDLKSTITESEYSDVNENMVGDMFQRLKSKVMKFFKRFKGHTREQLAKIRNDIALLINPEAPEQVTDAEIAQYVATSPDIQSAILRIVKNMKFGAVGGLGKVIVELIVLHPKVRKHLVEFIKNMLSNALTADEVKQLALKFAKLPAPEDGAGGSQMTLPQSPFSV